MRRKCLTLVALVLITASYLAAATEKVLYRFTGGADGAVPSSGLLMDTAGNLYGTTARGGDLSQCDGSGCGTVFRLTPLGNGKWKEHVLYAFQGGLDGYDPTGNLVLDAAGNLYGTTSWGGNSLTCSAFGCGTVFELSPREDGTWSKFILHDFQNTPDGADPGGNLVFDHAGNLYGATSGDTIHDYGTVFELSPVRGGAWTVTVLHNFLGTDGVGPSRVIFDGAGNLFGTTASGGRGGCCGTAFKLSPPKRQGGDWTETELYDFLGGGNGGTPSAGVIRNSKGNLYGTGAYGGNNFGIAFELRPSGSKWNEKMIYNFCSRNNCADGASPLAGLLMDGDGVLYGTTSAGGTGCSSSGCGVVFKLTPTKNGWKETILHRFRGGSSDGAGPEEQLVFDRSGNLYGTAYVQQGYQGAGVVFEITP
jgi:uncharacterized repeat protein (TIGR03803 family)